MELAKLIERALKGGYDGYKAITQLTLTREGQDALAKLLNARKVFGNVHYVFPDTGTRIGLADRNAALVFNKQFGNGFGNVYSLYSMGNPQFKISIPESYMIHPNYIPVGMTGNQLLNPPNFLGTTQKSFKNVSYNGTSGSYATIINNESTPLNRILMRWNNEYQQPNVLNIPRMYTGVATSDGIPIISDAMVFNPNANVFVGTSGGETAYDFVKYMAKQYGIPIPPEFGGGMIKRPFDVDWIESSIK